MPEVYEHLAVQDLLELLPGERLWKLFCFRTADGPTASLEHRIYTKCKPDGVLALITFAVQGPVGGPTLRSRIAHVPEISQGDLDHIIDRIRSQTDTSATEYQEVDLSHLPSLSEQWTYLQRL